MARRKIKYKKISFSKLELGKSSKRSWRSRSLRSWNCESFFGCKNYLEVGITEKIMVEKSLIRMYMARKWKRHLDSPPSQSKGYPIWKLLKASFPLIQSSLQWVPENGKLINLWNDGIIGSNPLNQNVSLTSIRQWMISQNKISIFDISVWHTNGVWKDWNLGPIPPHLQSQEDILLLTLKGATWVHFQK